MESMKTMKEDLEDQDFTSSMSPMVGAIDLRLRG